MARSSVLPSLATLVFLALLGTALAFPLNDATRSALNRRAVECKEQCITRCNAKPTAAEIATCLTGCEAKAPCASSPPPPPTPPPPPPATPPPPPATSPPPPPPASSPPAAGAINYCTVNSEDYTSLGVSDRRIKRWVNTEQENH
ncbi:hypothetical protein M427DRAFT_43024 [Gonapodya prolifera JEL478]|uniref:Uncharacterized protein n=1 Tax=Gonapodya prolifera (strain JEL478) TaxID=1344416 RepID=A0A139ALE3_GONPJ|nr:hypothetical protein M427DRAFT_43024 [Gonapodya prolifera JEL478]|eukprot:KXS17313.1 hypothetical protein M427DRAFT_43024 [Gonapodya prolifera JEL478]